MFSPKANQEMEIGTAGYRFAEHPAAPGMPYGQEGRAAVVYKLGAIEAHTGNVLELPRADDAPPLCVEPSRPLTMGRAPENAVRFASSGVSRLHATLELRDGRLFLLDNRSSNKTFVNDQPVSPETWIELPPGSRVRLGTEDTAGFRVPLVHSRCRALKVFKPTYRTPSLVALTERLSTFAHLEGLGVCARTVLTPQAHAPLLLQFDDLTYAVCMPWVEGPTWMEVVLEQRPLTPAESLRLATGFASIMAGLEQKGIAHCDLSGPNIMIPALADEPEDGALPVTLVDVEQIYGPGLTPPDSVPAGSPGYAPRNVPEGGLWSNDADRFGGAVAIAEMLGWACNDVRSVAWGESYFEPAETQTACDRYRTLSAALQRQWGDAVSRLLDRAWRADRLGQCPTFGEWLVALSGCNPESAEAPTVTPTIVPVTSPTPTPPVENQAQPTPPVPIDPLPAQAPSAANVAQPTRPMPADPAPAPPTAPPLKAPPEPSPAESPELTLTLNDARDAEDREDWKGALDGYRRALGLAADEKARVEIGLIIEQLEGRASTPSTDAAPPSEPSPAPVVTPPLTMSSASNEAPTTTAPVPSSQPDPELLKRVRELEGVDREPKSKTPQPPPPNRTAGYILIAVLAIILIAGIIVAARRRGRAMPSPQTVTQCQARFASHQRPAKLASEPTIHRKNYPEG